jgi:hypothetical protein
LDRPRSHDRPEDLAGQAPKLRAAEAEVEAEIVEASAPEPLDAGNVSQSYRKADRRVVADGLRRPALSDVARIVDEERQEGSQEAEAACEDREVSSRRSACAGQVVGSRLLATDDEQGGMRPGSVTAEAGSRHKVRMVVHVLGSRQECDDTLLESREPCVAAEGVGACSLLQVPSLPFAAAVAPLEPSAAASTDHSMASEIVLAAEHGARSSPAEEGTSSEVTAHGGLEAMEAVV